MALYQGIKKMTKVFLLGMIISVTPMFVLCAEGSFTLSVEQEATAFIGTEVTLSLDGDATRVRNASFEWMFEGSANRILLRNGGLESRFVPIDTNPITARVSAFGPDGGLLASAYITLRASEFAVDIVMIEPEPFMLWDANAKRDVAAEELIAGEPVQFEVRLVPDYDRPIFSAWNTDASTAILRGGSEQRVTIVRNDIGDAELYIVVRDADGLVLGRGAKNVNVPISRMRIEESNRRRTAWHRWLEAQSQWDAKNFDEAVATAEDAHSIDTETREIEQGLEIMRANHVRVERSRSFIAEAVSMHGEQNLTEALRLYRRAYAAWALAETEASIRLLESEIDQIRVRTQQAEWLRDTAVAYDQENRFTEALRYYRETLALIYDEAISQRAERIEMRLASVAQADALVAEGRELEAAGQFLAAVEKFRESLEFEADPAIEFHVRELEEVITARRTMAASLRTEATGLQGEGNYAEALLRFSESHGLWPDPEVAVLIASLEQAVPEGPRGEPRDPGSLGIGTRADAERLLLQGHTLYRDGRYREALEVYRQSYAIYNDARLADWISRVETSLNELDAVMRANDLIKQANDLYNAGEQLAALEKYKASLAIHHNAEVENFINMLMEMMNLPITAGG